MPFAIAATLVTIFAFVWAAIGSFIGAPQEEVGIALMAFWFAAAVTVGAWLGAAAQAADHSQ